jgi:hypothetical protein
MLLLINLLPDYNNTRQSLHNSIRTPNVRKCRIRTHSSCDKHSNFAMFRHTTDHHSALLHSMICCTDTALPPPCAVMDTVCPYTHWMTSDRSKSRDHVVTARVASRLWHIKRFSRYSTSTIRGIWHTDSILRLWQWAGAEINTNKY